VKFSKALDVIVILVPIWAAQTGVRIYWINQRGAWHNDEADTVSVANCGDTLLAEAYRTGRVYTGAELKGMFIAPDPSLGGMFADIGRLWWNTGDTSHTDFYYILARLSMAGTGSAEIKDYTRRLGGLNLFLFTLSFIMAYKLFRRLFPDSELIPIIAVFCAFISPSAIQNTVYFRPYQLQELFYITFAYFFVKYFPAFQPQAPGVKPAVPRRVFAVMSAVTAGAILTHYYALVFVFIYGLYIVWLSVRTGREEGILPWAAVLGAALLAATVVYPRYLFFPFAGQSVNSSHAIFADVDGNLKLSVWAGFFLMYNRFFTMPVLAALAALGAYCAVSRSRPPVNRDRALLFLAAAAYTFVILIIAPYKAIRYVMPVFPFFAILPATLLAGVKRPENFMAFSLLLCLTFMLNVVNRHKISDIYPPAQEIYPFLADTGTPVAVVNPQRNELAPLAPYMADSQRYAIGETVEAALGDRGWEEFYLLTSKPAREAGEGEIDLDVYRIEDEYEGGTNMPNWFRCQKVSKRGR
jgi:hypothetical protein